MTGSLDIEQAPRLLAYLIAQGHIAASEAPRITVLAGGVSNRTVLVEHADGRGWVLKQALNKLRVAADWYSSPERIHREALGIRELGRLTAPDTIPELVFEDREHHLLAMQAVPQPHENWKTLLLTGQVSAAHIESFGRLLGTVHGGSSRNRETLRPLFEDTSFFETLRLEPYYLYSAQCRPEAAEFLNVLVAATRVRRLALVHGDYSPKNVLVRNDRLVLLDHEVIHWGDPAFDVGFALAHLLSKAHAVAGARERFAAAAQGFWVAYRAALGRPAWDDSIEEYGVRHALACLLARAVGRSPLEYLDQNQRDRQAKVAIGLMAAPPDSVQSLATSFTKNLERNAAQ